VAFAPGWRRRPEPTVLNVTDGPIPVLVIGATGQQDGAVARALLAPPADRACAGPRSGPAGGAGVARSRRRPGNRGPRQSGVPWLHATGRESPPRG
jgi:hypothetical protein